jgi:hypothetical protein
VIPTEEADWNDAAEKQHTCRSPLMEQQQALQRRSMLLKMMRAVAVAEAMMMPLAARR